MFTGVATLQVSERSETPDVIISAGLWWNNKSLTEPEAKPGPVRTQ